MLSAILIGVLNVLLSVGVGVESRPASRPAGKVVSFQPGIKIDFAKKQVEVDGAIVLREGVLELFACRKGTREHESIVAIEARPSHVFQALGLIGLTPGTPPGWDEANQRPIPPTGDPVDVLVRYETDGRTRLVHASDWMAEERKPMTARTWVFAGSRRSEDGHLLADDEGTVVTVVDFNDALLALSESHSADNDQLWLHANTKAIPPVETKCTLILRAAAGARATLRISLDRFGRFTLGGEPITKLRLRKRLGEAIESAPALVVDLQVAASVGAPLLDRTVRWLGELGLRSERIRILREGATGFPTHDTRAGVDFVRDLARQPGDFVEQIMKNQRQLENTLRQALARLDEIDKRVRETIQAGWRKARQAFSTEKKSNSPP